MNLSDFLKAKHVEMQSFSMYEQMKFGLDIKTENGDPYFMLEIILFGNKQMTENVSYAREKAGENFLLSAELIYNEAKATFERRVQETLNNVKEEFTLA